MKTGHAAIAGVRAASRIALLEPRAALLAQHIALLAPRIVGLTPRIVLLAFALILTQACTLTDAASLPQRPPATSETTAFDFAHGVRFYVSAVNCEMNNEDAARINALARIPGVTVEVVFAGISGTDTAVVNRARADLGLTVTTRQIAGRELEQYKSIGGAAIPVALVVKGRQLKTIVAGEAMPRTVSIVESSLTLTAPSIQPQSP